MKNKLLLLDRVDSGVSSPAFSSPGDDYELGVDVVIHAAGSSAQIVFEQSSDGVAWDAIATFSMDTTGSLATPAIAVARRLIRARITTLVGLLSITAWVNR